MPNLQQVILSTSSPEFTLDSVKEILLACKNIQSLVFPSLFHYDSALGAVSFYFSDAVHAKTHAMEVLELIPSLR